MLCWLWPIRYLIHYRVEVFLRWGSRILSQVSMGDKVSLTWYVMNASSWFSSWRLCCQFMLSLILNFAHISKFPVPLQYCLVLLECPPFCFAYLQLCKVTLVFMQLTQTFSVTHTTYSTVQFGFTLKTCVNFLRHTLYEAVKESLIT